MIVLVDLGHVYWRNWFAAKSDVRAFEQTLELVDWYHKEHARLVVCCDAPRSKRLDLSPTYKANRDAKPREAVDALVSCQDRIREWGVPVLLCDGFEADDLIATLVQQAEAAFEEATIVSNDKDLYQLLSPMCSLLNKAQRVGPAECVAKFGVRPDQMCDWLTLVGDTADNIHGCDGVGPGRATDLLRAFGTLDGALAATDEQLAAVKGVGKRTIEGLRTFDPRLARALVTLMTDAPVELGQLWKVAA